jgi:hypothetical protein
VALVARGRDQTVEQCWICRRDPDFAVKAGRVLDLYDVRHGVRRQAAVAPMTTADKESQMQAAGRRHETSPPGTGASVSVRVRVRAWRDAGLPRGLDLHHTTLFDRVEQETGIEPFARLVEEAMSTEPYNPARTVYWIVDNGSSHAKKTDFSTAQRKALTPNDPSHGRGPG